MPACDRSIGSHCSITIYDPETRRSVVVHFNTSSRVCYLLMEPLLEWSLQQFPYSLLTTLGVSFPHLWQASKFNLQLSVSHIYLSMGQACKYCSSCGGFSSNIFSSFEKYLLWDDFIITYSAIWTEFKSGKLWVPGTGRLRLSWASWWLASPRFTASWESL